MVNGSYRYRKMLDSSAKLSLKKRRSSTKRLAVGLAGEQDINFLTNHNYTEGSQLEMSDDRC